MKKTVSLGIFVVLAACLVVGAFVLRVKPATYFEEFELEYESFRAIESVLSQEMSAHTSDLAVGLSEDALSRALLTLRGVSARSNAADGLMLSVEDVKLEIRNGFVPVVLSVRASQQGLRSEALLTARGVMFADHVETMTETSGTSARVHYRFDVHEIGGRITNGRYSLATRGWINRVIASSVGKVFVEQLRFTFPISLPVDFDISFTEETEEVVEDGRFNVQYQLEAPSFAESKVIRTAAGIPANGAIWFLASVVDQDELEDWQFSNPEATEIEEGLESLREGRIGDVGELS